MAGLTARSLALDILVALGGGVLRSSAVVGRMTVFATRGVWAIFTPPWFGGQILRQLVNLGFLSLPVVGLTAVFTGAALALNIAAAGGRFDAQQVTPQIVALGICRELGPVLAALMLAGRVSAAIAAELGAMRATEQLEALQTLSIDPVRYLVAPRIVATVIALPLLTLVADTIGVAGGWLVSSRVLGFEGVPYLRATADFLQVWDVGSGLIKAAAFGFIIALVGCFLGVNASGGARGVGRATTHAVVGSAVLIFAVDYLLTASFTR